MSKELLKGYLIAHRAPDEIMLALEGLDEPCKHTWAEKMEEIIATAPPRPLMLVDAWYGFDWKSFVPVRIRTVLGNQGFFQSTKFDRMTFCEFKQRVEEFEAKQPHALLRLPNFGRKSYNELKRFLKWGTEQCAAA